MHGFANLEVFVLNSIFDRVTTLVWIISPPPVAGQRNADEDILNIQHFYMWTAEQGKRLGFYFRRRMIGGHFLGGPHSAKLVTLISFSPAVDDPTDHLQISLTSVTAGF